MKKPQNPSSYSIVSLLIYLLLLSFPAKAASIDGKWNWTIETPDGNAFKTSMVVKAEGEKITGHVSSEVGGEKVPIQQGLLKGNKVSFTATPKFEENQLTVEYAGVLTEDRIKGTIFVVQFDAEFQWNAKLAPEDVDPTGEWEWVLKTPDGNTIGATLDIVTSESKVSGELVADNWAVELENAKIKGNKLTFATTNPESGQTYQSTGTISGSTIKGTVKFTGADGQDRSLEWTAKR